MRVLAAAFPKAPSRFTFHVYFVSRFARLTSHKIAKLGTDFHAVMVTDKPLWKKRIVVTRPQAQAASFCRKLAEAGAIPVRFPTIRITPMPDTQRLDAALRRLHDYAWIIFTSVNGVSYCWDRLAAVASTRLPASLRMAAIGPATAQALRERHVEPDFVPAEFVAERIAEGLGDVAEQAVLLPRAEAARKTLATLLADQGARVDEIPAYRTLPEAPSPEAFAALEAGVDVLTFTSSSTVRHYATLTAGRARRGAEDALVACIGPITAETARSLGYEVATVADEYTTDGLIRALERLFADLNGRD